MDPGSAEYVCHLGILTLRLSGPDESLALLDRALSIEPGHEEARLKRALTRDYYGLPGAVHDLMFLLENHPDHIEARY